jgi:uncharacterized RDD family membrane protein YckC
MVGDRLAEAWPRKKRDRQGLAEDSVPCAWHNRPATLVCVRCHAPYCNRCRTRPFSKQFYFCRRCQGGLHNRRFLAYIADIFCGVYVPVLAVTIGAAVLSTGQPPEGLVMWIYVAYLAGFCFLFVRDSLFRGAGIGKRMTGLRVVQVRDGKTPLTHGQGFVRWLSQFIPVFNLVDAVVPYGDPLSRRYGDRWAGTRVIDTQRKLANVRNKIARRLLKKGTRPASQLGMTIEDLARLV